MFGAYLYSDSTGADGGRERMRRRLRSGDEELITGLFTLIYADLLKSEGTVSFLCPHAHTVATFPHRYTRKYK